MSANIQKHEVIIFVSNGDYASENVDASLGTACNIFYCNDAFPSGGNRQINRLYRLKSLMNYIFIWLECRGKLTKCCLCMYNFRKDFKKIKTYSEFYAKFTWKSILFLFGVIGTQLIILPIKKDTKMY